MTDSTAVVEKSLRSVFVGNIPYEATEEKLREIFNQVGPVASFKLMHDRESGKPKGYGFCEYKDQETALSAMRNLNAFEIGGRPLRVDNACTEKSRMEMQSLMMGPVVESPYGNDVEPTQAPEAISNAVASLPPEQMFELMRQMQVCVRSNRTEARTMLLNNPQLAYALLQAQVVMRIIDPKTAVQLLHGEPGSATPFVTKTETPQTNGADKPRITPSANGTAAHPVPVTMTPPQQLFPPRLQEPPVPRPTPPVHQGPPAQGPPPPHMGGPPHHQGSPFTGPPHHRGGGPPPPGPPPRAGGGPPPPHFPPGGDFDLRGPPPPTRGNDQDMRMAPSHHQHDYDNRFGGRDGGRPGEFDQRDPRYRDQQQYPPQQRPPVRDARGGRGDRDGGRPGDSDRDYRGGPGPADTARDPRARGQHMGDDFARGPPPPGPPPPAAAPPPSVAPPGLPNLSTGLAGDDQEKANLIMQVLQLSDEQIRMLPSEQQASILQLKEQIQQSQQ